MAKVREGSTELVSSDVRQIQAMLDEETANREKAKVDAKGQTAVRPFIERLVLFILICVLI
jgi:hypothetical protein